MFISGYYGIYRSYMDGSNFKAILTGAIVSGIIVDSESDRLYWVSGKQVKSCLRDGSAVETAVQLGDSGTPWGLTKLNGVIYWGSGGTGSRHPLQCSSIATGEIATVYNGTSQIGRLTPVPSSVGNTFRKEIARNPCESEACSHICALRASSFSCLCPQGLQLAEDQTTCEVN